MNLQEWVNDNGNNDNFLVVRFICNPNALSEWLLRRSGLYICLQHVTNLRILKGCYSIKRQLVWLKFCKASFTRYVLSYYRNSVHLDCLFQFWVHPPLWTRQLVAILWHQKRVFNCKMRAANETWRLQNKNSFYFVRIKMRFALVRLLGYNQIMVQVDSCNNFTSHKCKQNSAISILNKKTDELSFSEKYINSIPGKLKTCSKSLRERLFASPSRATCSKVYVKSMGA